MNEEKSIPRKAGLALLLLLAFAVCLVGLAIKSLFSGKDTEKKPDTAPTNTEAENRRKEAETALKTPVFHPIPAEISVKPAVAPVPAVVTIPKIVAQAPLPPPIKKKFVTREDLADVFHRGARPLTRPAAVAALKSLGFGKSAAYAALSPDGRFASWLQFASDGIITWRN